MKKDVIKEKIVDFLLWVGCFTIIHTTWVTIEIALYGMTAPSLEDTVIGTLFSLLLWRTVRPWAKWRADT